MWTSGFLGLKSCHRYSGDRILLGLLIHMYLNTSEQEVIIKYNSANTCSGDSAYLFR